MAQSNLFGVVNSVILKFPAVLKFPADEISKFQKGELGKFIPNFPLKHVLISTNNNFRVTCMI